MTKAENRAAAKAWHAEREAERVRTGPLGISPGQSHIVGMKKSPRVVFQPKRITETVWQIEASIAGSEVRIISGLTGKADVDDWMAGPRKVAWLRSQGYAK